MINLASVNFKPQTEWETKVADPLVNCNLYLSIAMGGGGVGPASTRERKTTSSS